MQLDPQDYLDLLEQTGKLAFLDIEASGLRGDYNSVLVVSVKPYDKKPVSFTVKQAGNDQKLVREAKEHLAEFNCWAHYYGLGFDIPMLNTRLLKWGLTPLPPRHQIDMYYKLKSSLLTARRSQGHLLNWLGTPEQKMGVSADVWNDVATNPDKNLPILVERCESDVRGLEQLYKRTRHLIKDIARK